MAEKRKKKYDHRESKCQKVNTAAANAAFIRLGISPTASYKKATVAAVIDPQITPCILSTIYIPDSQKH